MGSEEYDDNLVSKKKFAKKFDHWISAQGQVNLAKKAKTCPRYDVTCSHLTLYLECCFSMGKTTLGKYQSECFPLKFRKQRLRQLMQEDKIIRKCYLQKTQS